MKKHTFRIILFITIVIIFLVGGCKSKPSEDFATSVVTDDLTGKSLGELMAMNEPIECDLPDTLAKARAEREPGWSSGAITKIFIKGDQKMRMEGILITTGGTESPYAQIWFDHGNEMDEALLTFPGELNKWYREQDSMASAGISAVYRLSGTERIICKKATFGDEIFAIANVCYTFPDC